MRIIVMIFLFCSSMKVTLGQNSTNRRWLFRLVPSDANDDSKYDLGDCNHQKNYVSSIELTEPRLNYLVKQSPIPLLNFRKKYYYVVDFYKANFLQAYQFCRKHSMELLRIEDQDENEFFKKYLSNAKINSVWLAASDLAEEGKFVWLSTGEKVTYSSFADNQPDNAGNKEHCVELSLWSGKYVWNDIPCTNTPNFICQVSKCNDFCIDM